MNDSLTLAAYQQLLTRTVEHYPPRGLDVLVSPVLPDRFCILRHDIDMSPAQALRIAEIEANGGVHTTYTVLLTGPFYSPFEKPTVEILRRIAALGHDIGLHFDAAWHDIAEEASLHAAIACEADILRHLLPEAQIRCFSFHNTTPFTMSARADQYGGLWNAYSGRLQEAVDYVSDSNGYWRFRSWEELIELSPNRVHILTHPEWWVEQDLWPAEKVCRMLEDRSRATWANYVSLLQHGGRSVATGVPQVEQPLLSDDWGRELLMTWLRGDPETAYLLVARRLAELGVSLSCACRALVDDLMAGRRMTAEQLRAPFEEAANQWIVTAEVRPHSD